MGDKSRESRVSAQRVKVGFHRDIDQPSTAPRARMFEERERLIRIARHRVKLGLFVIAIVRGRIRFLRFPDDRAQYSGVA